MFESRHFKLTERILPPGIYMYRSKDHQTFRYWQSKRTPDVLDNHRALCQAPMQLCSLWFVSALHRHGRQSNDHSWQTWYGFFCCHGNGLNVSHPHKLALVFHAVLFWARSCTSPECEKNKNHNQSFFFAFSFKSSPMQWQAQGP